MPKGGGKAEGRPLVVKRVAAPSGDGHHGGAWKIAYADFVTAMMAFFLLMWLVNATTDAQRRGISDYFAPNHLAARGQSGSGQPFGGRSLHSDGAMISNAPLAPFLRDGTPAREGEEDDEEADPRPRRAAAPPAEPAGASPGASLGASAQREAAARPAPDPRNPGANEGAEVARREAIARVAEDIREAVRGDPALAALARQVIVEEVPEGLRVQLVDGDGQPVFQTGQAAPNERGRALLARVASVLGRLPHPIEITGHTDATPFRGGIERSNWDLSTERANATRRLLAEAGIAEARMRSVAGRAEREPLVPAQPLDPANRRVAVLMLLPPTGGATR